VETAAVTVVATWGVVEVVEVDVEVELGLLSQSR
jgi:hypothetical protein